MIRCNREGEPKNGRDKDALKKRKANMATPVLNKRCMRWRSGIRNYCVMVVVKEKLREVNVQKKRLIGV